MYMNCSRRFAAAETLYALLEGDLDRDNDLRISKFHQDDPVTAFTIIRHPASTQRCELAILLHDMADIVMEHEATE